MLTWGESLSPFSLSQDIPMKMISPKINKMKFFVFEILHIFIKTLAKLAERMFRPGGTSYVTKGGLFFDEFLESFFLSVSQEVFSCIRLDLLPICKPICRRRTSPEDQVEIVKLSKGFLADLRFHWTTTKRAPTQLFPFTRHEFLKLLLIVNLHPDAG